MTCCPISPPQSYSHPDRPPLEGCLSGLTLLISLALLQAVLETIRNLMNTECVVPDWLHDIILGYGDPGSAHYSKMPNQISTLDFNDTFLSLDHLRSCFPGYTIQVTEENPELQVFPFR